MNDHDEDRLGAALNEDDPLGRRELIHAAIDAIEAQPAPLLDARYRALEKAVRQAMRAGWFTTNDAGDRAANAIRAALDALEGSDD